MPAEKKRTQRRPRRAKRPSIQPLQLALPVTGLKVWSWTCQWCMRGYNDLDRARVTAWALRHLGAHVREALVTGPEEADSDQERHS